MLHQDYMQVHSTEQTLQPHTYHCYADYYAHANAVCSLRHHNLLHIWYVLRLI